MHTQLELLDGARAHLGGVTYYRIAKELGITSAYMTRLTRADAVLSADLANKLAPLAGLDAPYVVACIEHERAQREHNAELSGTWRVIAAAFEKSAAAIVAVLLLAGMCAPSPTYAHNATQLAPALYTLCEVAAALAAAWLIAISVTKRAASFQNCIAVPT